MAVAETLYGRRTIGSCRENNLTGSSRGKGRCLFWPGIVCCVQDQEEEFSGECSARGREVRVVFDVAVPRLTVEAARVLLQIVRQAGSAVAAVDSASDRHQVLRRR